MLELHQFRHSPFCLKVRMALAAKELEYRAVEVTPAIGQLGIFQQTGQKKLPVLFDKETAICESSLIIRYLEQLKSEQRLIPENSKEESQAKIIENWADTTLANSIRTIFIQEVMKDSELLSALFSNGIPLTLKNCIQNIPFSLAGEISEFVNHQEKEALKLNLEFLTKLIKHDKWIVGSQMSIADISIAAHLSLLSFPASSGEKINGKGCPLFSQDPNFELLFTWKNEIDNELIKPNLESY